MYKEPMDKDSAGRGVLNIGSGVSRVEESNRGGIGTTLIEQ